MPAQPDLTQVERDKLSIDPDFDFKNDIARRDLANITPNELAMFKWSGIYPQLQKGFFMMRIRIPGGLLTADQLERIADLGDEYAQGQICITTRQTLQFHWLRKDDLWKVLEALRGVALDTKNACGDVTRNVVTCPLQGVCPHEIGDVRPMLLAIANDPELKDRQRNLPRKHKISVAGCGRACGQTLMNCQGWHPVRRAGPGGAEETGWRFHAGGGLGARPFMAKAVFAWVPEDLVLDVVRATAEVFRVQGDRRVRARARLKFVVDRMGPGGFADAVLAELRARGVSGLERIERATGPADIGPMFLGGQAVIPQRQPGTNTVRLIVPRSELPCRDARLFAGWARELGDGSIMLTARQNLQFRFVPDARVPDLLGRIRSAGYATEGLERLPDMVACVGTTQCNLAVSDTPNAWHRLHAELAADREFWSRVGPLRIHLNGCPNSCAQHWIADIGLRGRRTTTATGSEEGFEVCIGGGLGGPGHIARPVAEVPSAALAPAVRRILEIYLDRRRDGTETFGEFARRAGADAVAGWLGRPGAPGTPANQTNLRLRPVFDETVAWET
jgi:sulfite reductase beta subunit-like hemoprotein